MADPARITAIFKHTGDNDLPSLKPLGDRILIKVEKKYQPTSVPRVVYEQRTSTDMTNGAPKRSNRGGAAPNGASNHNNGSGGSSDDEERNVVATPPTHPTQRTSARRKPNIDLLKLEASSLRKYRRVFKLPELGTGVSKEDLAPAIIKHWQNHLVVEDEYETLLSFAMTLRKQSIASGGASGMHGKMKQKGPKRK